MDKISLEHKLENNKKMMYNFLDYKLKPFVIADCPSTDGYEVTNLISENLNERSKGFLAYTAIKPPINVDFDFICPINIYYILIGTVIDSQKSTGIECFIKTSNSDYINICRINTEDPGIIIYNRKYYSLTKRCEIPNGFTTRFCKTNMCKFTSCVEKLRIRIFRTKSSVPCIGKIEVWGGISRVCSNVTRNTIKQLLENCEVKPNENGTNVAGEIINSKKDFLNIPEEFIDPISCEIMSLPMTLPCGKTVDQITLEKHQESEAKWGRGASDPFTGQIFTINRKPVLNTALKSRIDEFLIQNSHREETFRLQRTLGRKIGETSNLNPENSDSAEIKPSSSSSLDDLLNNAMKQYNIVRFTEHEINTPNMKKICGSCKSELNLYELECKHFLCRTCVLKRINCDVCKIVIKKSNIKKYHNL